MTSDRISVRGKTARSALRAVAGKLLLASCLSVSCFDFAGAAENICEAEMIRAAGGLAASSAMDVADEAAVTEVFARLVRVRGGLNILHNHAGIQIGGALRFWIASLRSQ